MLVENFVLRALSEAPIRQTTVVGQSVVNESDRLLSEYLDHLLLGALVGAVDTGRCTEASPAIEVAGVPATPGEAPNRVEALARVQAIESVSIAVSGTRWVVPLIDLASIQPAPVALHRLPGQPTWIQGLVEHADGPRRLASLPHFFQAAGVLHGTAEPSGPALMMQLSGGAWALEVEAVVGRLQIVHGAVRWRRSMRRMPWLSGVLHEHSALVMDALGMIAAFEARLALECERPGWRGGGDALYFSHGIDPGVQGRRSDHQARKVDDCGCSKKRR